MPVAAGTYGSQSSLWDVNAGRDKLPLSRNAGTRIHVATRRKPRPPERPMQNDGISMIPSKSALIASSSWVCLLTMMLALGLPFASFAQDVEETRKLLIKGDYEECIQITGKA